MYPVHRFDNEQMLVMIAQAITQVPEMSRLIKQLAVQLLERKL